MGHSNLRASLEKRYSALTGQLREAHENIARIKREVEKLPEIEAGIPKLEALIESAAMLLEDADPSWRRDQTPAIKPMDAHATCSVRIVWPAGHGSVEASR